MSRIEKETEYTLATTTPLGQGASAKIYQARLHQGDPIVAIKAIENKTHHAIAKNEINILSSIKHRNIITLLNSIDNKDNTYCYLIMPYYPSGDLFNLITETDWEGDGSKSTIFHSIMLGVLKGIEYLHTKKIIHRDIKTENILVNKNNPIIIDFGSSIKIEPLSKDDIIATEKQAGSFFYFSREQHLFLSDEEIPTYPVSEKLDIYAVGFLFWLMWVGTLPQEIPNQKYSEIIGKNNGFLPFCWEDLYFPEQLRGIILNFTKFSFQYDKKSILLKSFDS